MYPTRRGAALLLGLPVDNVRVIYRRGAHCYGLNGADTVSYDCGAPVAAVRPPRPRAALTPRWKWRENYGQAYVIDQRVGVDRDGAMIAWDYAGLGAAAQKQPARLGQAWQRGDRGGSPGPNRNGSPHGRPAAVTDQFRNTSNAAPSYVMGCVGGVRGGVARCGSASCRQCPRRCSRGRGWSPAQVAEHRHGAVSTKWRRTCADPVAHRPRHLHDHRLIEVEP